jgi:hypothetical protein
METTDDKTFTVTLNSDSSPESVQVTIQDTTDGQPYYECNINGSDVQIRKDEKWEVIWGELDEETLQALGSAIDKHITKKPE